MISMAEEEGKRAKLNGKCRDDNPYYDVDTELHHLWEQGYLSVKRPRPDNPPPPPVRAVA